MKPSVLVGSSGSFDTFYYLTKVKNSTPTKKVKSQKRIFHKADTIDIDRFHDVSKMIVCNSLNDRLDMEGMPPDRADLIPYAAAIVLWVDRNTALKYFYRSKYAIREGVLYRIYKGDPAVPSYM